MWRVLNIVEQMSTALTDAAQYLEEALRAIDVEMTELQGRLHADTESLRSGISRADLTADDRGVLLDTLDRMEKTADFVATFAHRRRALDVVDDQAL